METEEFDLPPVSISRRGKNVDVSSIEAPFRGITTSPKQNFTKKLNTHNPKIIQESISDTKRN